MGIYLTSLIKPKLWIPTNFPQDFTDRLLWAFGYYSHNPTISPPNITFLYMNPGHSVFWEVLEQDPKQHFSHNDTVKQFLPPKKQNKTQTTLVYCRQFKMHLVALSMKGVASIFPAVCVLKPPTVAVRVFNSKRVQHWASVWVLPGPPRLGFV